MVLYGPKVRDLQKHRDALAFSDEHYDRMMAKRAKSPDVKRFYLDGAEEDHRFGMRRLRSAKTGRPLSHTH